MAEEVPAETTLVRCSQPNQSPHVVVASAGEVVGKADLRPSASAVAAAAAAEACTDSRPRAS